MLRVDFKVYKKIKNSYTNFKVKNSLNAINI